VIARRFLLLVVVASLAAGPGKASAAPNPVVVENQQPGTTAWQLTSVGTDSVGQIKGYASATSVNKGQPITFYVSVNPAQTFTIDVYRIGWYQGLGGRLLQHVAGLQGTHQATCPTNASTGMTACNWAPSYTLATQSSWTSGIYLAKLTNAQGYQNYIEFVVRDDSRVAAFLYQQPVTTYEAYNDYPDDGTTGKSLYDFDSYGANTVAGSPRAVKVSFDRPYADDGTGAAGQSFLTWEINFVRWMETSGYDVTYSTDVDTDQNGGRLLNYRALLSPGHDEYWSKAMYDGWQAARDAGVNLGFFGADAVAWQIRFESSASGAPDRVVVCYKDGSIDPVSDPNLATVMWWNYPAPFRPQQALIGVQYTNQLAGNGYVPYVVTSSNSWVYAGTGFRNGDSVPGIVGYEADRMQSNYQQPTAVAGTYALLSHSPFTVYGTTSTKDFGNSSVYQAPSGAWVFATGTFGWSWALDNYGSRNLVDARIQRTTANVFSRFQGNQQPDFGLTASPSSQSVAAGGGTSYSVTVTPSNGFTGQVSLSVSGLPTGASGSFSPNPTGTTSTLTVTTTPGTAAGSYPLTVTGTSGTLTHTTGLTLVVTSSSSGASNSYVTENDASSATAISLKAGAVGNLLVLLVSNNAAAYATSVNGGPTTGWTPVPGTKYATSSGVTRELWYATANSTTTSTATVSGVNPGNTTLHEIEFTNGNASTIWNEGPDGAREQTSGTTFTWPTLTPTAANAIWLGYAWCSGNQTGGTYSGWQYQADNNGNEWGYGLNVIQGTAYTPTGTQTGTDTTALAAVFYPTTSAASDFSLGVSPSSQSVAAGGGTSYSVTVTPSNGFTGQVSLSVSGLPTGASGSFSPNPTGTSSTLTVTTMAATAAGSYPLTITGTSGILTHTATATLVVSGAPDFSLAASPSSQSVTAGGGTSYSVTVTPSNGFPGQASLSVSGLPAGASGSFSPNPTGTSSTLTVTTTATTAAGSYPLTITGTSGILTHTTSLTLVVTTSISASNSYVTENDASSATAISLKAGAVGNLLVLLVSNNAAAYATSVNGGPTTGWTPVPGTKYATSSGVTRELWYATASSTTTSTATVSGVNPGNTTLHEIEFTNGISSTVWNEGPDGAREQTSGTTFTWPTLTPTAANAIWLGYAWCSGNQTGGTYSGWQYQADSTGNEWGYGLNVIQGTAYTPTGTQTDTDTTAQAAVFYPATS
jgi:hypothetical protein